MSDATAMDVLAGRANWSVACSDCVAWLRTLPDNCVHCCVTSPPYYGLRAYLKADDPAKELEIGSEETPGEYVARMVGVFRELRRVLHPSGSFWLNLGDSYAANAATPRGKVGFESYRGSNTPTLNKEHTGRVAYRGNGIKAKDLLGIPWMVAFALREDGWYLRQHCPWVKRSPMPESVTDRPGTACEEVFLLAKRPDYFFDMEAVKRPCADANAQRTTKTYDTAERYGAGNGGNSGLDGLAARMRSGDHTNRNFRSADLWFDSVGLLLADNGELLGFDVTSKPYKGAHFAVMPPGIVEPCVLAGTSAKGVCPKCGEPWTRVVERNRVATRPGENTKIAAQQGKLPAEEPGRASGAARFEKSTLAQITGNRDPQRHCTTTATTGWEPGCECGVAETLPAVVLDPFTGSGTVAAVAVDLGRRFVGSELNRDYIPLILRRLQTVTPPLFTNSG